MKFTQEQRYKLNGILGAIAFHMLLLFLFMAAKLDINKDEELTETFLIEFEDELIDIEKLLNQLPPQEEYIEPFDELTASNIAKNVASELEEEISTEKFIEEQMKELGIDDLNPKHELEMPEEEVIAIEEEKTKEERKKELEERFTYKGETIIEYDLGGRDAINIPVRNFRCKNGGLVIVDIVVDQLGKVLSSSVSKNGTQSNDPCVLGEAEIAAATSRFYSDKSAPNRQHGTITFKFIPQ